MGLFTYDVTLEHVSMPDTDSTPATPQQRRSWVAESGMAESVNDQLPSQVGLDTLAKSIPEGR